jgi:serine protease
MRYYLFCLLFCLLARSLEAQTKGEFIVQICDTCHAEATLAELRRADETTLFSFSSLEPIAAESHIYLLRQINNQVDDETILRFLRRQNSLNIAQLNHTVSRRNTAPNDPSFSQQWQYINTGASGGQVNMDLDADAAWDISTGGLTALGDTIVVAIIDDGAKLNHPDLAQNIWYNRAEIPNNGIDDDQNGYIDDYRGWNVILQNDEVQSSGGTHGTPIAGIIGAVGNNNIGVTGINWAVKLMIIRSNFNTSEATVLAAYNYALQARRKYNDTQGQSGAFVVATNASWGIDYAFAQDAPIWCAFYDTLGKYGILNAAATANLDIDVDTQGDLPTTCPSEYLLSVTNIDRRGWKVQTAAYGRQNIDFGAFGNDVYTLNNAGNYSVFGGTSAAAPHAAGAIALAYSALCEEDMLLARQNPQAAAQFVRRAILAGVRPNIYLDDISTTGGQLNLNGTLQQVVSHCGDTISLPIVSISSLSPPDFFSAHLQPNFAQITYLHNGTQIVELQVFDALGQTVLRQTQTITPQQTINIDLRHKPQANYIIYLRSDLGVFHWRI